MYDREELAYMNSCANDHYRGLDSGGQREYIKGMLSEDILKIIFTKMNGDVREMYCTLQDEFIPEHKNYHKKTATKREKNLSVLSVIDVEKADWRSFRIENLTDFGIVREEDLSFQFEKNNSDFDDIPF